MTDSEAIPTNPGFQDITGIKFSRLLVIGFSRKENYRNYWKCRCECGKEIVVVGPKLKSGHTKSCGCLKREVTTKRNTKHGLSNTPEHNAWLGIKRRCLYSKDASYKNYGGRGIRICDEWLNSFDQFIADMGFKPSDHHTIERIDNNGNYSKANCRWATRSEQAINKRNCVFVEFNGETKTLSEWSHEVGIGRATLAQRLKNGWPTEESLFKTPSLSNKRRPKRKFKESKR